MARVFITGSANGLGRAVARTLLDDGHEVVVHAPQHDRLTAGDDLDARISGGYWHHRHRAEPHPAVRDRRFRDRLLADPARFTATPLPRAR